MRPNSTDVTQAAEASTLEGPSPVLPLCDRLSTGLLLREAQMSVKPGLSLRQDFVQARHARMRARTSFAVFTEPEHYPKDEANVGLGELDRARNNVRRDFVPIKLCTLRINIGRTRVDKVSNKFRHMSGWRQFRRMYCTWPRPKGPEIKDILAPR